MSLKKRFDMLTPTMEVPTEILELVRMSVVETLVSDFYHSSDEHTKSAIDLHKLVATKYPTFYNELFLDSSFTNYFLDAHRVISTPYILQNLDMGSLKQGLNNMKSVQINRLSSIFSLCRNKELLDVEVRKYRLRTLFRYMMEHIEKTKGKDYVGYIGVKYVNQLKDIMALTRIKKEKMSPAWRDVHDWIFLKDTNRLYDSQTINEACFLRKLVVENKKFDNVKDLSSVRKIVKLPFTVWRGYGQALGLPEKEIYSLYRLMTNTELKRNLNKLQEYGFLKKAKDKERIEKRIDRTELDVIQLVYAIKVLSRDAKTILLNKGSKEISSNIEELKSFLDDKDISVAIDCSGGCAGHSEMLSPEFQKKLIEGEKIPKWAKIVQRESFNANAVIGYTLCKSSKAYRIFMFNEMAEEIPDIPDTFEELIAELEVLKPMGGSNILDAVDKAIEGDPDIAFIITDLNENIPFSGALKLSLESIAEKFKGILIFLTTETIVERPEATLLDDVIKERNLHNVFVLPVKRLNHISKALKLISLLERAKTLFIKLRKKIKKVEVE